jgi:hypothetical protein
MKITLLELKKIINDILINEGLSDLSEEEKKFIEMAYSFLPDYDNTFSIERRKIVSTVGNKGIDAGKVLFNKITSSPDYGRKIDEIDKKIVKDFVNFLPSKQKLLKDLSEKTDSIVTLQRVPFLMKETYFKYYVKKFLTENLSSQRIKDILFNGSNPKAFTYLNALLYNKYDISFTK